MPFDFETTFETKPPFNMDLEIGSGIGFDDLLAAQTLDDLVDCLGLDSDLGFVSPPITDKNRLGSTFYTEDRWPI
jgi:hypothetical protein